MEGTEAATLAQQYRVAANERDATAAAPAPPAVAEAADRRSRFGPTTISGSDSFFGTLRSGGPSSLDPPAESGPGRDGAARARRWFSLRAGWRQVAPAPHTGPAGRSRWRQAQQFTAFGHLVANA